MIELLSRVSEMPALILVNGTAGLGFFFFQPGYEPFRYYMCGWCPGGSTRRNAPGAVLYCTGVSYLGEHGELLLLQPGR